MFTSDQHGTNQLRRHWWILDLVIGCDENEVSSLRSEMITENDFFQQNKILNMFQIDISFENATICLNIVLGSII